GYMRLKDADKSDYGVLLLAEGVHFLSNGTIYLMGVPDSVPLPLEDLLHMLPSNQSMLETNDAITEQINKRIEELEKLATWGGQQIAESGAASYPTQHQNVTSIRRWLTLILRLTELENPQGITTIRPPPLEISSVMFSPNCGLAMSINEATGIKIEKYYSKAISYASMATVIAIVQIFALIHQMEYTPTPSSISNVSYWTIAMQAMMDGYICLLHLTTGVVIDTVFTPFAAAAFFSFVLYLPQTYNYHPVLPPEDEESPQGERSDRDAGAQRAPKECPVCMLPIDLFPSGHTGLHVLGRIQYMVTPCHHHFHTDCLEKVIGFGF
ncbi:hypothetical protein DFQ28_011651, partial [Apophysomyces sp. BC1034]